MEKPQRNNFIKAFAEYKEAKQNKDLKDIANKTNIRFCYDPFWNEFFCSVFFTDNTITNLIRSEIII